MEVDFFENGRKKPRLDGAWIIALHTGPNKNYVNENTPFPRAYMYNPFLLSLVCSKKHKQTTSWIFNHCSPKTIQSKRIVNLGTPPALFSFFIFSPIFAQMSRLSYERLLPWINKGFYSFIHSSKFAFCFSIFVILNKGKFQRSV